jgi:hypothetical protein
MNLLQAELAFMKSYPLVEPAITHHGMQATFAVLK